MKTNDQTLIEALRILANDIQSDDGVANACIAEGANRLRELKARIAKLEDALKLGLEYWAHRQQRYKNRSPVWVELAREALKDE
jgi:hypothetical protein